MSASVEQQVMAGQAGQERLTPEAIDHAVYTVGSHPVRVLTLAAFAEAPDGALTSVAIFNRINEATDGHTPPMDYANYLRTFTLHCTHVLGPSGYITELEPVQGRRRFQITPLGRLALAPAGVVAQWELRQDELSARDVFGSIRHTPDGELALGPEARFTILQRLMDRPSGLAYGEMTKGYHTAAKTGALSLADAGILEPISKTNPAHRRLLVSAPRTSARSMSSFMSNMSPEIRGVNTAASGLIRRGPPRELSGDELLDAVLAVAPDLNRDKVWNILARDWPNCVTPVDDDLFGGRRSRTSFRLVPRYYKIIADLLATVGQLKADETLWQPAADYASHLLEDGAAAARLVVKGHRRSRAGIKENAVPVEQIISEAIPPAGITQSNLLAAVVLRRNMRARTLRNHLKDIPGILVEPEHTPTRPGGSLRHSWVTNWARKFSGKWREQGLCMEQPELFFPLSDVGMSAGETARAKALCVECPVRPACLKTATDSPEVGIWGGYTEEERRNLPTEVKALLGHVTITT